MHVQPVVLMLAPSQLEQPSSLTPSQLLSLPSQISSGGAAHCPVDGTFLQVE